MIYDQVNNLSLYKSINKHLPTCIEFLENNDLATLELGKHQILGDELFYIVTEYNTQEPTLFEAHEQYIDFQLIIYGNERIDFLNINDCSVSQPYNPDTDSTLLSAESFSSARVNKNKFVIFFPNDAHRPCVSDNAVKKARKLIFKIKI